MILAVLLAEIWNQLGPKTPFERRGEREGIYKELVGENTELIVRLLCSYNLSAFGYPKSTVFRVSFVLFDWISLLCPNERATSTMSEPSVAKMAQQVARSKNRIERIAIVGVSLNSLWYRSLTTNFHPSIHQSAHPPIHLAIHSAIA